MPINDSFQNDQLDHNTKWCDINVANVFQFDHQPSNVIQVGDSRNAGIGFMSTTNGQYNNLYQVTKRLQNKELKSWQSWMNWVQKIQPDYKFLTVCQNNAQTCVFANVDSPWMFTQYIYQGIGKYYDPMSQQGSRSVSANCVVIQPALYNWNDLTPKNIQAIQKQYQSQSDVNDGTAYDDKYSWHKHINEKGWYKPQFGEYKYKRYTTGFDGCDLYKADILVQSVKWGQHGNIPPHVVNCMAPAQFLKSATKMTLKTINKPVVGIPLYSDRNGSFYKNGKNIYILKVQFYQKIDKQIDPSGNIIALEQYKGKVDSAKAEYLIDTPQFRTTTYGKMQLISTTRQNGQLIYNGCKYFKKLSSDSGGNIYGCYLDKDFSPQQRKSANCDCSLCTKQNKSCKYFTKSFNLNIGTVIVARYQVFQKRVVDTDVSMKNANIQLQNLANACMTTGTTVGAGTGLEVYNSKVSSTTNSTDGSTIDVKYQTSYQMVQQPLNGIKVNIPENAQNYKGATIDRGTGQSAFEQSPLPVRTIYNNDISKINFTRWLNQILPCYQRKYCNETVGLNNVKTKNGYSNCGIPYKAIQNNQIVTKNSGFCPYYTKANKKNIGCPYNSVNKGAFDYLLHNSLMYQNLYVGMALPIAQSLYYNQQLQFDNGKIYAYRERETPDIITFYYKDFSSEIRNFTNDDMAVIYLSQAYGIQQQVLLANHYSDLWLLCKAKIYLDQSHQTEKLKKISCFVKYYPYDYGSYTDGVSPSRLKDKNGYPIQWTMLVQNAQIPKKDPIFVDNQMKFVGGYHPQYLFYPSTPQQILYKKQQQCQQQTVIQTKAQASQFGQISLSPTKQVQYGYFVLQTGNWILDGGSIGQLLQTSELTSGQALDVRAQNPTSNYKGGAALHDRWENSIIDPQSDKPQQKKIKNCIIFSNDTKQSIQYLKKNPPQITVQNSEDTQKIPPLVAYPQYLPRQRSGCYCSNCKTVLALRFYQFDEQITKCPWCGQNFQIQKPMQYFPRTKAMGRVSVWGLPGTVIKTDTYFWKSQAMVNNALLDQMKFKLGVKNQQGGGYSKTDSNFESEKIDRVDLNTNDFTYQSKGQGKYSMDLTKDLVMFLSSSSDISFSSYQTKNLYMVNPNMKKDVVPFNGDTDNRIINPFTRDFNGLQMVTIDYISAFRNRLQPTLAYVIGKETDVSSVSTYTISSNGQYLSSNSRSPSDVGQYQQYRVSYNDRRQLSYLKKWVKRRSVVNNVVLAYAGPENSQAQAYVQFPVGDQQNWYWAKKYYPPDPHWWYNKGYIGGIATSLTGNFCHIDNSVFERAGHRWDSYRNLKENLYSSVFICPHGYLPADKIVVAAYMIQPGTQYSCDEDPVGQFQIPGINSTRVACNHYHSALRCVQHQKFGVTYGLDIPNSRNGHVHSDSGNFKQGDTEAVIIPRKAGQYPSLYNNYTYEYTEICSDGTFDSFYIDKYGDKFYVDSKTGLPVYQRQYKRLHPNKFITKTQDVHLNSWHEQNLPYVPFRINQNLDSVLSGLSHHKDTHIQNTKTGYGNMEQKCIQWNGFGTDIVYKSTQNQIWKQYSTQEFEKYQELYSFDVEYQIDFGDGQVQTETVSRYYTPFNNFISQQMQNIPGYFDFEGQNSSKLLKRRQAVSKKTSSTSNTSSSYIGAGDGSESLAPDEKQDDIGGSVEKDVSVGNTATSNTTGQDTTQAGQSDIVVDITNSFKNLYYGRSPVSYTVKTGDYSLQDLDYNSDKWTKSKWTGVGKVTSQDEKDMKNYNTRYKMSDSNGYILNSNYWLPNTQQPNSAISFSEYQKITINNKKIYFTTKKQYYYNLCLSDKVTVNITKTQIVDKVQKKTTTTVTQPLLSTTESSSSGEQSSSIVEISEIVSVLQKCGIQNVSAFDSNIIIEADQKTSYEFIFDIKDESSRITFDVTPIGSNRIVQYTGYTGKFHPYFLTNYYKTQKNPNPQKRSWKTSGYKFNLQTCIIDLYHTPLQRQRRNYRVQAGHVDNSNAYCENQSCQAGQSKIPMAIYAKNRGVNFSTYSSKCPFCDKQLKGGSIVAGDGIYTYLYNDLFQQDQIIRSIQLQLTQNSNDVVCPFAIFIGSDLKTWQCIFSGIPRDKTSYYYNARYHEKSKQKNQFYSKTANQPLEMNLDFSRGRYLKICMSPVAQNVDFTFQQPIQNHIDVGYIKLNKVFNGVDDGCFSQSRCIVDVQRNSSSSHSTISSISAIVTNNTSDKLFIQSSLISKTDKIKRVQVFASIYKTCLHSIKIGGVSYSKNNIAITPSPTTINCDYNSSGIKLNYLPIQFLKVSALLNDSGQIILNQIKKYSQIQNVRFFVQVVTQNFDVIKRDDMGNDEIIIEQGLTTRQMQNRTIKYYRVMSGNFYFDVASKVINIPKYFYCETNVVQLPFGQKGASIASNVRTLPYQIIGGKKYYRISKDLLNYNLTKWGIEKKLAPSKIDAVIWSGMQGGLTLPITADGRGPAYQVQKGSICFIDTPKYLSGGQLDNGLSTPLPNTSKVYSSTNFIKDVNEGATQKTIPWIVYNRQLVTIDSTQDVLGKSGKFYVNTDATKRTSNTQNWFVKNIMGDYVSKATGVCKGQITLKGKPNTIISGQLVVLAAPVTVRNFCGSVRSYQLTGGLSKQGMLFTPKVKVDKSRGDYRIAVAYETPYILVYLKQDSPMKQMGTNVAPQFCKSYYKNELWVVESSK